LTVLGVLMVVGAVLGPVMAGRKAASDPPPGAVEQDGRCDGDDDPAGGDLTTGAVAPEHAGGHNDKSPTKRP